MYFKFFLQKICKRAQSKFYFEIAECSQSFCNRFANECNQSFTLKLPSAANLSAKLMQIMITTK